MNVRLTPKASKNALVRIDMDADGHARLRATVTAVPEKGKANKALIALLAKKLGLQKSALSVIAGETSQNKSIFISGPAEALRHALDDKLKEMGLLPK